MHEAREVKRSQRKKRFSESQKRKSESFLDFLPRGKLKNASKRRPESEKGLVIRKNVKKSFQNHF